MNPIGRLMQQDFAKGLPYRNQLIGITDNIDRGVTPVASQMQDALVQLLDPEAAGASGGFRGNAAKMAGGKTALARCSFSCRRYGSFASS